MYLATLRPRTALPLLIGTALSLACGGRGGAPTEPNAAPVITSTPGTSAKAGHPYSYTLTIRDDDGDAVTLNLVTGPTGAVITGGKLQWTPTAAQAGSAQAFQVRASDARGAQSALQSWSVTPAGNALPVITSSPASSAFQGTAYSYTLAATDADGDPISYALTAAAAGATLSAGTLAWTPSASQAGQSQTFTITASDGFGGSTPQTWSITPRGPNQAPVITSAAPLSATGGSLYSYSIVASDPDGDTPINYVLAAAPQGASLTGNQLSWTPAPGQERVANSFTVNVLDSRGAMAVQTWTVTPVGTIRGTSVITRNGDGADAVLPNTAASISVAALISDGNGGWTSVPGTVASDGTFSIPGVPAGSYWLLYKLAGDPTWTTYVDTTQSAPDLGQVLPGRASATLGVAANTYLTFNLAGFVATTGTDIFGFYAHNLNSSRTLGAPTVNGTTDFSTLASPQYRKNWNGQYLVDMTQGDHPYFTQLATHTASGTTYVACERVYEPFASSYVMTDGSATLEPASKATVSSVPQTSLLWANVARSAFAAPSTGPGTATPSQSLNLCQLKGAASNGEYGLPAYLVQFTLSAADTSDLNLGSVPYGSPYPASWDSYLVYDRTTQFSYTLPGTSTADTKKAAIHVATSSLPSANAPLAPLVTPVLNARIGNLDLGTAQTGVGLTPTLSWTAPATGTPSGYAVTVYLLSASGSKTVDVTVAKLYSKATSLTLPSGILTAGGSYLFKIQAQQSSVDPTQAPFRMALPYGSAELLSAIMVP